MQQNFEKINKVDENTKTSGVEKFMFQKISMWVLLLFIFIGILFALWFGYLVTNSKTAFKIAKIPDNIKRIFDETKDPGLPLYLKDSPYINKPKFKRFINTKRDELLLLARYDGDLKRSIVEIVSLNDFSVLHTYQPDIEEINSKTDTRREEFQALLVDRSPRRYQITHPLIDSDGDLLFQSHSPLVKIDFCNNLLWLNDEDSFHHSNNIDHEGNYWVPSEIFPYSLSKELVGEKINEYRDDAITKISKDGKILYQKSVIEILIENGYKSLIFGSSNFSNDPIHLNDIQPALNDTEYWKKGDLFLSSKHRSIILHFRPQSNKLVNIIRGPFFYQHDVDIISDKEISIFNNNYLNTQYGERILNNNSEVVIYNFETKEFYQKFPESMKNYSVKSQGGGLSEILGDGSMLVESESSGRILFFNSFGDLEWEFVNKANNDKIYYINWVRIIKNRQLIESVKQKIQSTKCTN